MDGSADRGELWRLALEHSPVGMTLVDLEGRMMTVNRALCEILGYDAEELSHKGFQEITHPDDLEADLQLFDQALSGEIDSYRMRKRYLHADGHEVWGDLSVALLRDDDGAPLHFISQILDVTEQREYAEALKFANAQLEHERGTLEAIFETVDVGLVLIDNKGRVERMNGLLQEHFGSPERVRQTDLSEESPTYFPDGRTLMAAEDQPSYRAWQGEEFDDLRMWVGEDPVRRRAFSVSARSVRGRDGKREGAALAYQDITDLMRAMQVKDDFVASVSHELRTPLTSVLGHLELLNDRTDLPADAAQQVRVIERNAVRLRALVSDLLHVASARDGLRLELRELDLRLLVLDATEAARPAADTAGLELVVDVPEELVVTVDPHRLRQVVDNLLGNAIKYTDAGGTVTVCLEQHGSQVDLSVTDTGMGIDEADREQIFNRFFRGEKVQARHIQGTGLGLSIVSSIVSAHGGTISLDTEPGAGTTFRVTLPHAAV